jgi:hypothetical protein
MFKQEIIKVLSIFIFAVVFTSFLKAQNEPVMYFCEKYDKGETGISDRFTTGYITVMVKCNQPLGLKDVYIQMDKFNATANKFEYYKDIAYTVSPDVDYIYFDGDELSFDQAGFYRVFLLDDKRKTVTSALIEIVNK